MRRLIDAKPLMQSGWHLVQTGESNRFIQSMSLADIPTVDAVEVVHGKWAKQVEDGMYWYECSECGGEVPKTRYKHDWYSNYCPNCGAKMDGDGNG